VALLCSALHPREAPAPAGGDDDAELPEERGCWPGYAADGRLETAGLFDACLQFW